MVLRAREVAASTYNTSAYVVAAGFYLLLTIPLGRLVQRLENRLAASEGGTAGAAAEPALEPNAGDVLPPAVLPHERSAR
jgi:polar amino acid transport system substrate-binding protein